MAVPARRRGTQQDFDRAQWLRAPDATRFAMSHFSGWYRAARVRTTRRVAKVNVWSKTKLLVRDRSNCLSTREYGAVLLGNRTLGNRIR